MLRPSEGTTTELPANRASVDRDHGLLTADDSPGRDSRKSVGHDNSGGMHVPG